MLVSVERVMLAAVVLVAVAPDVMVMAPVLHGVLVVLMMLVRVAVKDSMVAELLVKLDTDTLLVEVVCDKLAVA